MRSASASLSGKLPFAVPERAKRRLQVDRHRVVDAGLDAVVLEVTSQGISPLGLDDVEVEDGLRPAGDLGPRDGEVVQRLLVPAGDPPAGLVGLVEATQLHPQDRGLERVEAPVEPTLVVLVLDLRPEVAKRPDAVVDVGVTSHHHAGVTEGSEVLGGVEAEGRRIAERAGSFTPVPAPVGLARVLEDQQPVPRSATSLMAAMSAGCP